MKLQMYEVLKKRTATLESKLIFGGFILLAAVLYIWVMTDNYTAPSSLLFGPKEIVAGEKLHSYHKKEVTCEIPYVISHVVDFYRDELYDEDDENIEFYTHGYIGLDENLENPFFFFVPPERKEEVENMMLQTQAICFDGEPKRDIGSLQVTGYVRISREKHLPFYQNALIDIYGHADLLNETDNRVYVLDDQNVSFGGGWERWMKMKITIFLIVLTGVGISFREAYGGKNRRYIRKSLEKYRIDEFELNQEFIGATERAHNYWIGRNYTFFVIGSKPYIMLNNEVVLVYGVNGAFHFYTLDKSRFAIKVQEPELRNLLDYYETNFPRVMVGMNEELHRMLVSDFDAFLEMKYRKN